MDTAGHQMILHSTHGNPYTERQELEKDDEDDEDDGGEKEINFFHDG
jgi:hypothetical protein